MKVLFCGLFFCSAVVSCLANIDSLSILEVLDRQSEFYTSVLAEQKDHRDYLGHVLNKGIWTIGIFFGLITAILGFFGFKSWQNFKQSAEHMFSKKAEDLLIQQIAIFDQKRIAPLKKQLDVLQQYKNAQILFLGESGLLNALKSFIQPIFHQSGMHDLVFANELNNTILKTADIIVLHYNPDYAIDLITVLKSLKNRTVPVVIYSPDGKRQSPEERQALQIHQWYTFANMPLSLVTQIDHAASVFYGSRA